MASVFEKWNKMVDGEALAKEVKDIQKNGGQRGDYKEVPKGEYEVSIKKMELKESSNKNPMISVWFEVLAGEYKGSLIFMNQVITQPFQVHIANEFLRSLGTGIKVEFEGDFEAYNDTVMDIAEAVDGRFEYLLNYSETKKGFSTFQIEEIFELE